MLEEKPVPVSLVSFRDSIARRFNGRGFEISSGE